MSTVYTQMKVEKSPIDVQWLTKKARILVGNVMRHMHMDSAERSIFREDMLQEGLSWLYRHYYVDGHDEAYAYAAARTNLIGYVFVNIRGGGNGHQWELSKQYRTDDNLSEPEYIDEDSHGERTFRLPAVFGKLKVYHLAVENVTTCG